MLRHVVMCHAGKVFLSVYFLPQMRFYEDKRGLKCHIANEWYLK